MPRKNENYKIETKQKRNRKMHADIERSFRLPLKLLTAFAAAVMLMLVLTVRADAAVSNKLTVSVADWKETGVAIKRPAGGARFAKPEKKAKEEKGNDDRRI